jgi:hypothetical protein
MDLISAFSDNEGIIFVTTDIYNFVDHQTTTLQFHRLYHRNWLYLGHYVFKSRKIVDLNVFRTVFLVHGRFVLYEDVQECIKGYTPFICLQSRPKPPRLYLLDDKTDSFKLQKSNIDYSSFDFYTVDI